MSEQIPEWLRVLYDEYADPKTQRVNYRSSESVARMARTFAEHDPAIMIDAVNRYLKVGSFFPRVPDLWPHVTKAVEAERAGNWEGKKTYTDIELLEAERERGALPSEELSAVHNWQCPSCGSWRAMEGASLLVLKCQKCGDDVIDLAKETNDVPQTA